MPPKPLGPGGLKRRPPNPEIARDALIKAEFGKREDKPKGITAEAQELPATGANVIPRKIVILKQAYEWGKIYLEEALKIIKQVPTDPSKLRDLKLRHFTRGVEIYLQSYPQAYNEWNKLMPDRRFSTKDLAEPMIKSHLEDYFVHTVLRAAAAAAAAAPGRVERPGPAGPSQPPPPAPATPMAVDPPPPAPAQKSGGFKAPSRQQQKRPAQDATPPQAVPSNPGGRGAHIDVGPPAKKKLPPGNLAERPPRLNADTVAFRDRFYRAAKSKFTGPEDLTYSTRSSYDYKQLARDIRGAENGLVYQAPGIGLGYHLAGKHVPGTVDRSAEWREWAGLWDQNRVIGKAWKAFFNALQQANYGFDYSSRSRVQIVDFATKRLRAGINPEIPLGPLRLRYKSHGTHNVVYTVSEDMSVDVSKFPPSIRNQIRNVVFRVPLRPPNVDDTQQTLSVAREMVNIFDAADFGFGPAIWVAGAYVHTEPNPRYRPDQPAAEQQYIERCEFFSISQKLDFVVRELFDPVLSSLKDPSVGSEQLYQLHKDNVELTMQQLSNVVFAYSIKGMIHLDASLLNFMVSSTAPQSKDFVERLLSVRDVFAIDLDPKLFRHLNPGEGLGESGMSDSWMCVWLYNVLFLSGQLKAAIPELAFDAWQNQVVVKSEGVTLKQVIQRTLAHLRERERTVATNPSKPQCYWVTQALWEEPIGPWTFRADLLQSSSPQELVREMCQLCKHYFIHIQKSETVGFLKGFIEMHVRGDASRRDSAAYSYNITAREYQIPTRRYFQRHLMARQGMEVPARLVDVLYAFMNIRLSDEYPDSQWRQLRSGFTTPDDINNHMDDWIGRLDSMRSWPRG